MSIEETTKALEVALAGDSDEAQLEAVLALPDEAMASIGSLEAARDGAGPRLEVAILDALYRIAGDSKGKARLEEILDALQDEGDASEELYMMARIAFNRIESDDEDPLQAEGLDLVVLGAPLVLGPERLGIIIHGTWAKNGTWWRTDGDFHTYLMATCGLDYLYDGSEPFIWSGRNRNSDRHGAALAFREWVNNIAPDYLEVYAHSHGANVAMLSTQDGLAIQKLVMLSPPVRSDYFADWGRVGEAYNIQAAFDPVVGIARGGRWFQLPQVQEKELDARSHSASHDPQTWEDNDVPTFVGLTSSGLP